VIAARNQYMVYVPNIDLATSKRVKTVAPDAFISHLDSGQRVIQLGRYNNLNLAQRRIEQLRQAGVTAEMKPVAAKIASIMPSPTAAPVTSVPALPSPSSFPASTPALPSVPGTPIPVESSTPPSASTVPALPNVPNAGVSPLASIPTLPGVPNTQPGMEMSNTTVDIVRPVQPVPQMLPQAIPQNTVMPQGLAMPQTMPPGMLPPGAMTPTASMSPPPIPDLPRYRYFVIIPTTSAAELQRARMISPTAQLRSSGRGPYIEVQGYPDRGSAETLVATMRRQGFDARVVFF
jgi:hypothetical protein